MDLSLLPKIPTHAQLGSLGDPADCSIWNPASWPTCSTWITRAQTELADAHNQIIALANGWQQRIQDISNWPESQYKNQALNEAQGRAQETYQLVQQHSQVQNEFEAKIQPFKNVGLAGLGQASYDFSLIRLGSVKGLGLVIPVWAFYTATVLVVSALGAWGVMSAVALNNNYKAQAAFYNQFSEYYKTCQELATQGKPCDVVGPAQGGPGAPWAAGSSSFLVLGGLAFIMIMAITRK